MDVKKRFTEQQIVSFLKEADTGVPVKDLARRHGFSEASYYLWRNAFGGTEVSDAKRLRGLEAEKARLKKLLAEATLENEVTKEALRKNGDRTASSGAGAVDASEGHDGTAGTAGGWHKRQSLPLPTTSRP